MKKIKFMALALLFGATLSCAKTKTTPVPAKTSITPVEIAKNCLYGAGSEGIPQQNLVITDSVAWNNLKAQMNSVNDVSSGFTEQTIDFTQWTVIASFDQVRNTGGYALDYSAIVQNSNDIVVTLVGSAPNGFATMVITQPYKIVKIPVTNLPITFN